MDAYKNVSNVFVVWKGVRKLRVFGSTFTNNQVTISIWKTQSGTLTK